MSSSVVFATATAVFFIIGLFTQTITIIIFSRENTRTFQLSPFFINIAISNIVSLVFSYPLAFASSLHGKWVGGKFGCDLTGFFVGVSAGVSFITMAAFAYKIYSHVTSFNTVNIEQVMANYFSRHTIKILGGIWIYSGLCLLPPLIGWSSMTEQSSKTNCAPNWVTSNAEGLSYLIFLMLSVFILPMAFTGVIFYKLHQNFSTIQSDHHSPSRQYMIDHYKLTQKVVAVAFTVNAICWSPYAIYSIVSSVRGKETATGLIAMIPAFFAKTSAVFNPVVYWILSPRYRRHAWNILTCSRDEEEEDVHVGLSQVLSESKEEAANQNASSVGSPQRLNFEEQCPMEEIIEVKRSPEDGRGTGLTPIEC